jgi:hypothetical protein
MVAGSVKTTWVCKSAAVNSSRDFCVAIMLAPIETAVPYSTIRKRNAGIPATRFREREGRLHSVICEE